MTTKINVVVGERGSVSIKNALAEFASIWKKTEAGEPVTPKRVRAFESWGTMVSILSPERYRLLDHLHEHDEPSVSALARSLNRPYRRVHDDVVALSEAGLVDRSGRSIKSTVDSITTEIVFGHKNNSDTGRKGHEVIA